MGKITLIIHSECQLRLFSDKFCHTTVGVILKTLYETILNFSLPPINACLLRVFRVFAQSESLVH